MMKYLYIMHGQIVKIKNLKTQTMHQQIAQ